MEMTFFSGLKARMGDIVWWPEEGKHELAAASWGSTPVDDAHRCFCTSAVLGCSGPHASAAVTGGPAITAGIVLPPGPRARGQAAAGCGDDSGDSLPCQRVAHAHTHLWVSFEGLSPNCWRPERDETHSNVFRLFLFCELMGTPEIAS